MSRKERPLHIVTPLLESIPLKEKNPSIGSVFLKMDNVQPVSSFKIRGLGNLCQKEASRGKKLIISSSGGNAGYAAAYSGRKLGIPTIVVVPTSTPEVMRKKIQAEGAQVIVSGNVWDEAHQHALSLLKQHPEATYIPPFDHPDIWEGNSTIIEEIKEQIHQKPDAVICSVGGGGLLNGIVLGLQKVGWNDVPVIAAETLGADSFYQTAKAGKMVTLKGITSIAKTLGALRVSEKSFELFQQHKIIPEVVTDTMAVSACEQFADDHRSLVEPSCGASLAIVYEAGILKRLLPNLNEKSVVVVIVCGGQLASLSLLEEWKKIKESKL